MNELPVTVNILDRPYKLKISRDDEYFLRKAAELIGEQAASYGKMYAYNDRQDLLAMVALTQITQLLKLQQQQQLSDKVLEERLSAIDQLLDQRSNEAVRPQASEPQPSAYDKE